MTDAPFGLNRRAFPASPDLGCYYPATGHERALEQLLGGLHDGEGALLLVGAPGTGKTLLCHALIDRLGDEAEAAFLTHTRLHDRAGLLQALLFDLGLPHRGRGEQEMRLELVDHLLKRYAAGKRTVLVLDEAQHLSADLLEELRLLGNLEGRAGAAVPVVLVGQTELLATLGRPELASLRQRIAVRAVLAPLEVEEAADYLLHHVRAAGGQAEALLSTEALQLLARGTGGVPRLLNQAGHLALRLAAGAGAEAVDAEAAVEALAALGLEAEPAGGAEEAAPLAEEAGEDVRLFAAPGQSA
jgi:type II secretory pathway predicted ATPase ExeA